MYSAEANIGNTNKTLYNGIQLENTYHLGFYYDPDGDYVVLQQYQNRNDQKTETFGKSYLEDLEKYIGNRVEVPSKDSIPFIKKIIGIKRDHSGNLVGDRNKNPILDTRIYEIEFRDGRVQ